jgi:hypothetical protein
MDYRRGAPDAYGVSEKGESMNRAMLITRCSIDIGSPQVHITTS